MPNKKVVYVADTQNESFKNVSELLNRMGIYNNTFMLERDNSFHDITMRNPEFKEIKKIAFLTEIYENPFFFFREVLRVTDWYSTRQYFKGEPDAIPAGCKEPEVSGYKLTLGRARMLYNLFAHTTKPYIVYYKNSRQQGKTIDLLSIVLYYELKNLIHGYLAESKPRINRNIIIVKNKDTANSHIRRISTLRELLRHQFPLISDVYNYTIKNKWQWSDNKFILGESIHQINNDIEDDYTLYYNVLVDDMEFLPVVTSNEYGLLDLSRYLRTVDTIHPILCVSTHNKKIKLTTRQKFNEEYIDHNDANFDNASLDLTRKNVLIKSDIFETDIKRGIELIKALSFDDLMNPEVIEAINSEIFCR